MMKPIIKSQHSTHERLYLSPGPLAELFLGSAIIGRIVLERNVKISCSSQKSRASTSCSSRGTFRNHCHSLSFRRVHKPYVILRCPPNCGHPPSWAGSNKIDPPKAPRIYPEPATGYKGCFSCPRSRLGIPKESPASGPGKPHRIGYRRRPRQPIESSARVRAVFVKSSELLWFQWQVVDVLADPEPFRLGSAWNSQIWITTASICRVGVFCEQTGKSAHQPVY